MAKDCIIQVYRWLCLAVVSTFVVGGVALGVLFPPFQVADEDLHWLNSIDIVERFFNAIRPHEFSDCKATTAVTYLFNVHPTKSNWDVKPSQNEFNRLLEANNACAKYTPIPSGTVVGYTGVLLARLFVRDELLTGLAALTCFYLARILQGFMVAIILIRLVRNLWRAPTCVPGVLSVTTFALSPMFMNQSFGVTYDTVTLTFAMATINMLLFWARASLLDHSLFLYFMAAACISKPVFFPLALAVVAFLSIMHLLRRRAENTPLLKVSSYLKKPVVYLYPLLLLVTAYCIKDVASSGRFVSPQGVDPTYNKAFLLADWGRAFSILWNSAEPRIRFDYLASPLGWTNVLLTREIVTHWEVLVYAALSIDLLLVLIMAGGIIRCAGVRRGALALLKVLPASIGIALGMLAIILLSSYSMYVLWTPKDSMGVVGLQNRYFLSIYPLLFALLPSLLVSIKALLVPPEETPAQTTVNQKRMVSMIGIGAGAIAISQLLPLISGVAVEVMKRFH